MSMCKDDVFPVTRIHMGLTLLAEILERNGHTVRVVDFSFLTHLAREGRSSVPSIAQVVRRFEPDVVGLSVFSYLYDECCTAIDQIAQATRAPIILGGPHFAVFPSDFKDDHRVSYVLCGEAETEILGVVERAQRREYPEFIRCRTPTPEDIPFARLSVADGHSELQHYQIQLSRGCPYHCTFCNVEQVAGRKLRKRSIETCLDEIVKVKRSHPNLELLVITDDCPTADIQRFKRFLVGVAELDLGWDLWVDNVRANLLDEELIDLFVAPGGSSLCLGTESGNEHVFSLINKGERLDEIVEAAELIKNKGLGLGLCFVIGLPEDTLKRHRDSIRLAQRLKPDYVFWNMCIPWPNTQVHDWFAKNGEIGDQRNTGTLIDHRGNFSMPVASTKKFSRRQRVRAWLGANFETHVYFRHKRDLFKLLNLAFQYNAYGEFLYYLTRTYPLLVLRDLKTQARRAAYLIGR